MKVVSVMTTDSSGGAEFAAVEMLDALAARGHETVMLTDQPGLGRDTRVAVRPLAIGPKLSTRSYRGLALRFPSNLRKLAGALRAEQPFDVLLLHYKKEQLMSLALPRTLAATVVWAEWGPVPLPLRQGPARHLYASAARRASAVMAISDGTRRSLLDVGVPADRVEVVPNVLRTDEIDFDATGRERVRRELEIADTDLVVGCISRFHPKKRNDVVIDAVASLGDPRVHLILAGDGETEGELRAQAAVLGPRAHFLPTPRAELAAVLSAFDVSVFCPSPTEGAPRAVILAMLARRPCIATGAEGVAGMIADEFGTICHPENDAPTLARTLAEYLRDGDACRARGEAARRYAEATYAAPVVAAQVEALLTRALAR